MVRLPLVTVVIALFTSALTLLPQFHSELYFDWSALTHGQYLGLISGHFVHADLTHFTWNVIGLGVIGSFIELYSRRLLLASLAIGIISVDLLLISPLCNISTYCGLSGVLNSLLVTALGILWHQTRSPWVIVTTVLCITKILVEVLINNSLFTHIAWPAYAPSHLAGAVGGALIVWALDRKKITSVMYNYDASTVEKNDTHSSFNMYKRP